MLNLVPLLGLLLVGGIALDASSASASEKDLKRLAECISESGAEFYGAHWCPYCAKQKAYFGEYADLLPYIECSDPGSGEMLPKCEGILGMPTWKIPNHIPREAVLTPEKLAEATGCALSSTDQKNVTSSEQPDTQNKN